MNVLFLTHRLPYAPNRGDRIRAYHLMRDMSRFARVSLFSFVHDDDEAARAGDVPFAERVVTARVPRARNLVRGALGFSTSRPLTHSLLDAPQARQQLQDLVQAKRPDLVVAYCSGMARLALEPPLNTFPLVVDFVDVDSRKWKNLSLRAFPPRRWVFEREARTLAQFEALAAERARAVLVVNEREREALRELTRTAHIDVVANGIDVASFAPPGPPTAAPVVSFCGVMDYQPNVDAVTWFGDHVWPRVRAELPSARFVVIGANPAKPVLALGARDRSVEITGRIDSVQPHLWRSALSVAPVRVAQGVQNKVLESLAAGLPTVITPMVRAGLPEGVERGCVVAEEPAAFSRAVIEWLGQPASVRRAKAAESRIDRLAWPVQLANLEGILRKAARSDSSTLAARALPV